MGCALDTIREIGLPDIDLPNIDLPNVDLPNVNLRNIHIPNINRPNIDLEAIDQGVKVVKRFLLSYDGNSKFRLDGLLPSVHLPSKKQLHKTFGDSLVYSPNQLPPKTDLRNYMTPVEDQSQIGSCTANCFAGAYEYLTKRQNGKNTDVSRLFIYYNSRARKNSRVTDSGCSMTSAIEALEEFGVCLESIWPYDITRVNIRPGDDCYRAAAQNKIIEALKVTIDLHEMKSCLAQGYPFAFGLKLYGSFDQATRTGIVPMPKNSDRGRKTHGSHALLAVGYSDLSQSFIVRNSWGERWGDKGYCYIPYDYMLNKEFCFDAWTIRKVATDNLGQDHWDKYDSTNYRERGNGVHGRNADGTIGDS